MSTTPTIDLPKSKVRVVKPNPETGEIIERVIPAKDFRPKLPSLPRIDDRRITVIERQTDNGTTSGATGRSVAYMTAIRELELEYWEAHGHILTRAERRQLADAESTSILRPIPPVWSVGDRFYVASSMEAEVAELTESARGYGTVFRVHDHRVRYLRRGVIGPAASKTDEHGFAPTVTPDEEVKTRLESAYTTSPSQSIDEAGGIMDEDAYQRIHSEQSATTALTGSKKRVSLTESRLLERLAEAQAKHRTSTVRYLERQLESIWKKQGKLPA